MSSFFELGSPSILKQNLAFGDVRILIVESDFAQAQIIKNLLFALGCTNHLTARSAEEALEILQEQLFDIIISGASLAHMGGVEFTRKLRREYQTAQRRLPLLLLGDNNINVADVVAARDSGINEMVIRPFPGKIFIERLFMLAEQPRNFVLSEEFTGPDRRRINPVKQLMEVTTDKPHAKRSLVQVVSKDALAEPMPEGGSRLVLPDYSLKVKVGLHVPEELIILSNASELTLNASRGQMRVRLQQETVALGIFAARLSDKMLHKETMREILRSSQLMAQESLLINYHFASEIAEMLVGFVLHFANPLLTDHQLIIKKHVEVLQVAYSQQLSGDGGPLGAEMLSDLSKLIQKFIRTPS